MLIKQSPPAPGETPISKPTLHTRKNHDVYNGVLHLPLTTHVQLISASSRSEKEPGNTNADHKWTYLITLFYPHQRACELHRSHEDVSGLEKLLAEMGCGVKGGITTQPGLSRDGTPGGDNEERGGTCQNCQDHGKGLGACGGEKANLDQTGRRHNGMKTRTIPAIMLTTPTISSQASVSDIPRSTLPTTTTTETDAHEHTPPSSITDDLLDFYFLPPAPQPITSQISPTGMSKAPKTATPTPQAPYTPYPNHACARTCSCPCLGPHSQIQTEKAANAKQQPQTRIIPAITDIRDVTTADEAAIHLQNLLSAALHELESSKTTTTTAITKTGNGQVAIPLAWFLKRRMGDCGGLVDPLNIGG